jgi:hypothetical protein
MTFTDEQLARVGNVVAADYRHVTKHISPGTPLVLADTRVAAAHRCAAAPLEPGERAFPAPGSGKPLQAPGRWCSGPYSGPLPWMP